MHVMCRQQPQVGSQTHFAHNYCHPRRGDNEVMIWSRLPGLLKKTVGSTYHGSCNLDDDQSFIHDNMFGLGVATAVNAD